MGLEKDKKTCETVINACGAAEAEVQKELKVMTANWKASQAELSRERMHCENEKGQCESAKVELQDVQLVVRRIREKMQAAALRQLQRTLIRKDSREMCLFEWRSHI